MGIAHQEGLQRVAGATVKHPTDWRTIQGYETMHMIRKGQVRGAPKGDIVSQVRFIQRVFGLAA